MAKIGIKGLTYAPYTSGGEGGSITYGTGVKLDDYMIRADLTEEHEDIGFYADDHKIDRENSMNGLSISLELSNITDDMEKTLLGYKTGTGNELNVTDAASPFVGVGFIRKERFKGTLAYHAYWLYKVQLAKESDSAQTKGESIEFQTETLSGDAMGVKLASDGDVIYYSHLRGTTEAAARTWLNSKAGISVT